MLWEWVDNNNKSRVMVKLEGVDRWKMEDCYIGEVEEYKKEVVSRAWEIK